MAHELGGDVAAGRPSRVRAGQRQDHDRGWPVPGLDREQPVWMSHGDSITRLPDGFESTAQTESTPFAGLQAPEPATCTASSSTRRWSTRRAARTCCATSSTGIAGARAVVDGGQLHRDDRRRHPRAGRRPCRADRIGRQGHLRAVGRRRLGGRGRARPSRGRRSTDLHLRRPRADAQEGVGAPARRRSSATSA